MTISSSQNIYLNIHTNINLQRSSINSRLTGIAYMMLGQGPPSDHVLCHTHLSSRYLPSTTIDVKTFSDYSILLVRCKTYMEETYSFSDLSTRCNSSFNWNVTMMDLFHFSFHEDAKESTWNGESNE